MSVSRRRRPGPLTALRTKIRTLKTLQIFGTEIKCGMNGVSPDQASGGRVLCAKRSTEPKPFPPFG
jgi:hypothetical protein